MPYIKPEFREVVDVHIEKVVERALREGDITPDRMGNIISAIAICSYQRRIPVASISNYVPMDTLICRDLIKAIIKDLPEEMIYGALNYCITRFLVISALKDGIRYNKGQAIMEAIEEAREYVHEKPLHAMLTCVEMEFYRKVMGPYEDIKCEESGDVYEV